MLSLHYKFASIKALLKSGHEFTQSWAIYLIWVVIVYGTSICYVNSLSYPAATSRRSLGSLWWRGAAVKRVGLLWYWKWKWMNVGGLIREESCGCVSTSDTVALYTCAPRTDTDARAPAQPHASASSTYSVRHIFRGTRCLYQHCHYFEVNIFWTLFLWVDLNSFVAILSPHQIIPAESLNFS